MDEMKVLKDDKMIQDIMFDVLLVGMGRELSMPRIIRVSM